MRQFITSIPLGDCKIEAINIYNILNETSIQAETKHNHSFYEMHIIRSGVSKLVIDETLYETREKHIIIIPKYIYHYALKNDDDMRFTAFTFDFTRAKYAGSKKQEYDYFLSIFDSEKPLVIPVNQTLENIYKEIVGLQGKYDIYTINKMYIKIAEFFLEISNIVDKKIEKRYGEFEQNKYGEEATRKQRIEDIFASNLDYSLEDFAKAVYLSPRQFERFICKAYGKTFKEIILEKRMVRSRQLIEEGKYSLSQISLQVGFSSYAGFFAAYKKYYGKSPSTPKKI